MTHPIEETIDKYELFLDLYGRKRYADEMKQCREEERETIALNMLKAQYHLEQIAKLTGLDTKHILKIAKDNNLLDV